VSYVGDIIAGEVRLSGVSPTVYAVHSRNLTRNLISSINVSVTGSFLAATGGALEVYNPNNCYTYPSEGGLRFYNIKNPISPNCNYRVASAGTPNTAVTLLWN
jgi:hypothetical protein